jgi:pimeloyl-ACP methyl ester carboxylesterase
MGADLSAERTMILGAAQRPISATAFTEKTEFAAWHTVPSFAVIPTEDRAIGAANERVMAKRANAQTTEVNGASHLVLISRPEAVVKVIESAAGGR